MKVLPILLLAVCLLALSSGVRHHLNQVEVARAVQLLEDGNTQREVAVRLGGSSRVINRLWRRIQEDGLYTRRPCQGRRLMTTPRQDRYLRTLACRNRQNTARSLATDFQRATGVHVCNQTVRNRLHEDGMRARRPARGPTLTPRHRRARLEFARDQQAWQVDHWAPVLFSDENRFTISTNDRRVKAWRRSGERYADWNIVEFDHYGGGSVMVWSGICLDGRKDLTVIAGGILTGQRYRNEILEPVVRPFAGAVGENVILVQENARPHTARVSMNFLDEEGINTMPWSTSVHTLMITFRCQHLIQRQMDTPVSRRQETRTTPPHTADHRLDNN